MTKSVFRPTLATDFANTIPDYADLIIKPDYADMICPEPDNADHHYGHINIKYTPLEHSLLTLFEIIIFKFHNIC